MHCRSNDVQEEWAVFHSASWCPNFAKQSGVRSPEWLGWCTLRALLLYCWGTGVKVHWKTHRLSFENLAGLIWDTYGASWSRTCIYGSKSSRSPSCHWNHVSFSISLFQVFSFIVNFSDLISFFFPFPCFLNLTRSMWTDKLNFGNYSWKDLWKITWWMHHRSYHLAESVVT